MKKDIFIFEYKHTKKFAYLALNLSISVKMLIYLLA